MMCLDSMAAAALASVGQILAMVASPVYGTARRVWSRRCTGPAYLLRRLRRKDVGVERGDAPIRSRVNTRWKPRRRAAVFEVTIATN